MFIGFMKSVGSLPKASQPWFALKKCIFSAMSWGARNWLSWLGSINWENNVVLIDWGRSLDWFRISQTNYLIIWAPEP